MNNSGKWLIAVMVAAGLAAGVFSWWFRYGATHRAAEYWRPAAVRLIRDAPRVRALRLVGASAIEPPGSELQSAEKLPGASDLEIAHEVDVSQAQGLVHLRHALLEDRSYDWRATAPEEEVAWAYGIEFADPANHRQMLLLIDRSFGWLAPLADDGPGQAVSIEPISSGMAKIVQPWFR